MSNEWYTPPRYINAARNVMHGIDLDPASCELANQTVKAAQFFTKEQNGLEQPWHASSLWLNPPFGRSQTPGKKTGQGLWIEKLVREYEAGHVNQAILLTTCRTDASWFWPLWSYSICFADHKVGFLVPGEKRVLQEHSHDRGTLFVYFGVDNSAFVEIFKSIGPVVAPDGIYRKDNKQFYPTLWECLA